MSKDAQTILDPVEQRIFGLIHVAQGAAMILLGDRAPNWILPWIMDKSQKKHKEM